MEEYYLMWLARVMLHQEKKAFFLLGRFGSAEAIFHAEASEIRHALGSANKLADQILNQRKAELLDEWIAELEEKNIFFYSYFHPSYPMLLKQIYNPPLGIYVRGTLPDDNIDRVGVIGARRCSSYGASVAYRITKDLGKTNVIVVSGLAKGIDAVAHKGIMDGGGKTIAVLGCGADICYPAENRELMQRIIENGCVLTEYPPGTKAMPFHFPYRNRIISGLCKMIVVIEAGKRSGTLITADLALENGRDVFVLPGNVTNPLSEGTNNLIKQGCPIITESGDILFELGISYRESEKEQYYQKIRENLDSDQQEIYQWITENSPITAEELSHKLERDIRDIQYMLSILEISGYIRKLQQSGYVRNI
ncbi:MAG TPA: DNA-processing protein DprA [Candidatus Anaerotignum merdipullorum]|nr:DNA-processing protein DprA [Candidatus Anaerotignum merdipullorum]